MTRSRVAIALLSVVLAIVIQTTIFSPGRIQPLGVAPALVTLVVVLVAPYLEPEYHLLLGFTAGILLDLIGSGTLGIWAMTMTGVAYIATRIRMRFAQNSFVAVAVVFALTILGQVMFILLSTLFGQNTIAEPQLASKILLPAVWNVILAFPLIWLFKIVFKPSDRVWAT
ncbi:MAG: rod shape-determining protein MreD [Proteobacteria bacterium]|nr:rod shape-determining protein MreD [Pseudomonadota bacterium]